MYVIVNSFQATDESLKLEDRVDLALRRAGIPILYTSLTDFIAFFLGSTSSLKGISSFCVYAAISIMFDFFLQVTMFVAIMVMDENRKKANKLDCCCCFSLSSKAIKERDQAKFDAAQKDEMFRKPEGQVSVKSVSDFFEWFAIKLSKIWPLVVLAFFGMLSVGIWAATEATEGFDANKLVLDDSHFKSYNTMNKNYDMSHFDSKTPVYIYVKDVDYHLKSTQQSIMKLTDAAVNLQYSNGPPVEWIREYLSYLETQRDVCPSEDCDFADGVTLDEATMKKKVQSFLDVHTKFKHDISLNSSGAIIASRSMLWHDKIDGVKNQIASMEEIVKLCDESADFGSGKVFADSWLYIYVYQFVVFADMFMTNFGLVLLAVAVVSPFILKQPVATILLLGTIAMIDTELYGMVHIYGDKINSLTGLGLIMAVGLVVDYNAHIIHAFFSNDPSLGRVEKLRLSLKQMGRSVFFGGLTSLLGLLPLIFSKCEVFRVFFRMTMAIIILGLIHGLVFMPALLVGIPLPTPPPFVAAHKKYRGSFFDQYHATPHKLSPAVADECVENDRL